MIWPSLRSKGPAVSKHRLNCLPFRGHYHGAYQPYYFTANPLPAAIELKDQFSPVFDQGDFGSCVDNALAAVAQYSLATATPSKSIMPSRMFIYREARILNGDKPTEDSGSSVKAGVEAICTKGFPDESVWPYDKDHFSINPPSDLWGQAWHNRAHIATSVDTTNPLSIKSSLASRVPVVVGIAVYDSFESDVSTRTGLIPLPNANDTLQGYHCIVLTGFDDAAGLYTVRNSWGTSWGLNGYGYMPYAYAHDKLLGPQRMYDGHTVRF